MTLKGKGKMDQSDNSVILHESLTRPMLMAGGERNLVLMLAIIAGVFIISLAKLWAAIFGVTLWMLGMFAINKMAKHDPQLSLTGLRSLRYKKFYPAQSTPFAEHKEHKE